MQLNSHRLVVWLAWLRLRGAVIEPTPTGSCPTRMHRRTRNSAVADGLLAKSVHTCVLRNAFKRLLLNTSEPIYQPTRAVRRAIRRPDMAQTAAPTTLIDSAWWPVPNYFRPTCLGVTSSRESTRR